MEAQIQKLQSQLAEVQERLKAEQEALGDEEAGEDAAEDEADAAGDEVRTVPRTRTVSCPHPPVDEKVSFCLLYTSDAADE